MKKNRRLRTWMIFAAGAAALLCSLAPFAIGKWKPAEIQSWMHALTMNSVAGGSGARAWRQAVKGTVRDVSSMPVTLRAAKRGAPYINLSDGHAIVTNFVGDSTVTNALAGSDVQPLSLASADFDEDGVPDLVSGMGVTGGTGTVVIHRGNVDALWPYGAALRNGAPPSFLPDARTFYVPEPPDFIGTGDFNADGHWDIVTAHRGSNALWFLPGDGHGGFGLAQRIDLPGGVTAFTTGEMNRPDGLTDIAVAVAGEGGAQVLIFESPMGALRGTPEIFQLPAPAAALAMGNLSGGMQNDLAVGAGNQLVMIHGRDRKLSLGSAARDSVPPASVSQQTMPFSIMALATGNFSATTNLAALGNDGAVHLLENSSAVAAVVAKASRPQTFAASLSAGSGKNAPSKISNFGPTQTGTLSLQQRALISRAQKLAMSSSPNPRVADWTVRANVTLPSSAGLSGTSFPSRIVGAHVSTSVYDDIVLTDRSASQVHIFSDTAATSSQARMAAQHAGSAQSSSIVVDDTPGMTLAASLDVTSGAPTAVLPMRLNQHGLNGLVVLSSRQAEPNAVLSSPTKTFTVNTTTDLHDATPGDGICADSNGLCSLRAAIEEADAEETQAGSGLFKINFNIPNTDPNRNPATGVFTIFAHSQGVIGGNDTTALPAIFATITIDGYTQPGASPNTLPNGDNAIILIQIDGSQTVVPGGDGLLPFFCVGTVVRGFDVVNFSNPQIITVSGGTLDAGAYGIEDEGRGGFDEGNFLGVDATGENYASNVGGLFKGQDAPPASNLGTTIGGTVPQARNIISGNLGNGMIVAGGTQIQGNFVGTDRNGTKKISNGNDGILIGDAAFVAIGGTIPGARNILSGNQGSNIDINALGSGSANVTFNDIVQGNYIGTDVTGTVAIQTNAQFNAGVLLAADANLIIVGGTTPAARNIISGNGAMGVDLNANAFQNVVQGNYIGLSVSGSTAVPNGFGGVVFEDHDLKPIIVSPAFNNTLGGSTPGAGNVISGNVFSGVTFFGSFVTNPIGGPVTIGNSMLGNIIGMDPTATIPMPNQLEGIGLVSSHTPSAGFNVDASNETIGGTDAGAGNIISNNSAHGVVISGSGSGNQIIGNTIQFNGGAGVRVLGGTGNLISRNSIFGNGALGIDLDTAGPLINSHCQANTNGANLLQNAPVLTAGTGSTFITATATDPGNNTSEFSNAVRATQTGNILSLLGTFDGKPSTTFVIEFFSSPTADASGFGQGQTYIGSTTVTTDASCTVTVNPTPVDTTQADVSATLSIDGCTFAGCLQVGPNFGSDIYRSVVTNIGPATAHNVVWTDTLPANITLETQHSNQANCCSVVSTSVGSCNVSGSTITCNLGTMPAGATATIKFPFEVLTDGSVTNSANVSATETDPNPANNSPSFTASTQPASLSIIQTTPAAVLTGSPDQIVIVSGSVFNPANTVTFTDPTSTVTPLPVTGFFDNQSCIEGFSTVFCEGLQVTVPAALLATSGTGSFTVKNPLGHTTSFAFTIAPSCSFTVTPLNTNPAAVGGATGVVVNPTLATCSWTASSAIPWAVPLDPLPQTGNGSVTFAIAPNTGAASRSGNVTVAGQSITLTQAGGATCDFTLTPPSISLPAAGGTGTVGVTVPSGCTNPIGSTQDSWITTNGLTNPSLAYAIAQNLGGPRTGYINIGGEVFTINQASASNCWFTLSSNSTNIATTGGTGSVAITASDPSCAWTASSDSGFAGITSGASGTGNGTIGYSVAANSVGPRTAKITAGNPLSNSVLSLQQASAFACSFTLSPNSVHMTSEGGSGTFLLMQSFSFCIWQLSSNDPANINFTMPFPSGQGQQDISYTVTPNPGTTPRTLTLVAGCQTFTVNQDGAAAANPVPTITTLVPPETAVGSPAFTLTVNGTNFMNGSTVTFAGLPRTTTFVNSTQVTAPITAADVSAVASPSVTVTNPTPGGGVSNSVAFNITGTNPVPVITTLQPSTVTVGSANFSLTVNGSNFIITSVVNINGSARATAYVSPTQVTATILAADVTTLGTAPITVTNPGPGGGTSNSVNLTIGNPVPQISFLSQTSVPIGSADTFVELFGFGFISTSVANFGAHAEQTIFLNSGEIFMKIPAADLAGAGKFNVTVVNPAPGGGTSNSIEFDVTGSNPVPTITTLVPPSGIAGSGGFTLTVNGTNFVSTSVVNFGGNGRATTFVSGTQVTALILAGDIAAAGTPGVTVTNPAPGGGTSNTVVFNVNNPVPALTSLVPITTSAGSAAFTLTVNGIGFINGSVVQWNGSNRATTFVNAGQVTAAVTAADIQSVSSNSVTVVNAGPGGGTSNTLTFSVTTPVPVLISLVPNNTTAGGTSFTLTLNGSNFINSSTAQWNGSARNTTFVNSGQLTAQISAADIQTAGTASVTVFTPTVVLATAGGPHTSGLTGTTSNALTFTINAVVIPTPVLTSIVPNSATAGGAAFTLTLNGSNFINTSVVQWNGSARTTTFVNSGQLTASISAADIMTAGTASVTVLNPTSVPGAAPSAQPSAAPSGNISNSLTFTVNAANPVPTLTSLVPSSTGAGGATFTLALNGTNFISNSVAQWKGSALTTTFVNAGQLTASIPASDIATSGTAAVTVVNSAPGGGTSNALTFTITDFSVTPTTPTQTVTAGQTANFTIATATVLGAFPGNVTFTASGLPSGANATFSPLSVSAGTSTTMMVTTTPRGVAQVMRTPNNPRGPIRPLWLVAFAMMLALVTATFTKFGRRTERRLIRRLIPIGALALLLVAVGYMSGCNGGFPQVNVPTGTPAGTYPITVTGTSGTVQHSTMVTLTVQ